MTEETQTAEKSEPIEVPVLLEAECPSLTGRSILTYQVGQHPEAAEGAPLFRIARNSGKGMWCKEWAPVSAIDGLITKTNEISARTLNEVHPGKSINTGGFILAVLKDLGVVQLKPESRHHERVGGATLAQAVAAKLKDAKGHKPKAG